MFSCIATANQNKLTLEDILFNETAQEERDLYRSFGGPGRGHCNRRFRPRNSITEMLALHPNLGQISGLIQVTGMEDILSGEGSYTFFAPRDISFDRQQIQGFVNRLYRPQYYFHAQDFLKQHIIDETLCQSEFNQGITYRAQNGGAVTYLQTNGIDTLVTTQDKDAIDAAVVVDFNNQVTNGVVHIIEGLLPPQWILKEVLDVISDRAYTTLRELIVVAGMEGVFRDETGLGDGSFGLTLFAPTNQAFENLEESDLRCLRDVPDIAKSILSSHTLDGIFSADKLETKAYDTIEDGVSIAVFNTRSGRIALNGDVKVIDPDNLAYSGILHGIDEVLLPDEFGCDFGQTSVNEGGSVLGILREEGMNNLVSYIEKTGLTGYFTNPNAEITIFAPTDEAFAGLSRDSLSCLDTRPQALKSLLQYHVLDKMYFSADLRAIVELLPTTDRRRPMLVNGRTAKDGRTQVNDAGVEKEDILASNGVIHKISRVIHSSGAECM